MLIAETNRTTGTDSWLGPLREDLLLSDLHGEARRRLRQMLEAKFRGTRVDRFRGAVAIGESLVADFVLNFLAIAIGHLADNARFYGLSSFVLIGPDRYQFRQEENMYLHDTIDYHLLPYPDLAKPDARPLMQSVDLSLVPRFRFARLSVPPRLHGFHYDAALGLIAILFESGARWITTYLREIVPEFGNNLSPSLYSCVREELGQGSDEHLMFATLPRGRGSRIIYLVDEPKVSQLVAQVTERARAIGESPVRLAGEFMKNNVEYARIHARHAVERGKPTNFDLKTSQYRDDHDLFNEAEIGWYGSEQITIFPVVNGANDTLMAVCGALHRERVANEMQRLGPELANRFHRHREEAIEQLDLLNSITESAQSPDPAGLNETEKRRFMPVPFQKKVYISYAWGGNSENVAEQIEQSLGSHGIACVRDKGAAQYKDSIGEFMKDLSGGKCIVVVLSQRYLESKNCMYELTEIAARGDFQARVFPVILSDANIYDPVARLRYVRYWEEKSDELDKAMKLVRGHNLHGIREDLDLYEKIRATLAGIVQILSDMNALSLDQHQKTNFELLRRKLEER